MRCAGLASMPGRLAPIWQGSATAGVAARMVRIAAARVLMWGPPFPVRGGPSAHALAGPRLARMLKGRFETQGVLSVTGYRFGDR
jgi:hypothetical protein